MLKLRFTKTYYEEVETIEDASREVRAFTDRLGLGASAYKEVKLYDESGKYLGVFSYYGRFWPKGCEPR